MFNEGAINYAHQTAEDLWEHLRAQLFNDAHVERQRDLFERCRWSGKETIELFAERLRPFSHTLPEMVSEEALTYRFIQGLPRDFHPHSGGWSGTFAEHVSKAIILAKLLRRPSEKVLWVGEGDATREVSGKDIRTLDLKQRRCSTCHQRRHLTRDFPPRK